MALHPFQTVMVDDCRALIRSGHKRVLMQLPTGGGKTIMGVDLMTTCSKEKNKIVWFVVHRRELVRQTSEQCIKSGLHHGIMATEFPGDPRAKIQICSVQSIANRLSRYPKPDLIIIDEAHHCAAKTWSHLYDIFPDSYYVGLTATPTRGDGKGLDKFFDKMVIGPTIKWLIQNQFLSPYDLIRPDKAMDFSEVSTKMGEYDKKEIEALVNKPAIIGDTVLQYKKHIDGSRAIVFSHSLAHSKSIVEAFNEAGIPAAHVDGETHWIERDLTLKQFEKNQIKIVSNVNLFGEGYNLPGLEAMIDLQPTKSVGRYLQKCGRALRYAPGKTAVIMDQVSNYMVHGYPCDDRDWVLESDQEPKEKKEKELALKHCKSCFIQIEASKKKCPICGFSEDGASSSKGVEERPGELVRESMSLKAQQAARTPKTQAEFKELVQLGVAKGVPAPRSWAMRELELRGKK